MSIGYAIIGCGAVGFVHAKAISLTQGAKLIGCYDARLGSAAAMAAEYGCFAAESPEELYACSDVQVISVCTPSGVHLDTVLQAAANGKYIVCEKPLDTDQGRVHAMLDAVNKAGVQLFPVLQKRLSPDYLRVRGAFLGGAMGRIHYASAKTIWYRDSSYYAAAGWHGSRSMDGGVLLNQGIHCLDQLLSFMPEPVSCSACAASLGGYAEAEDTVVGSILFADGAMASVEMTTAAKPGLYDEIALFGEKGSVVLRNGRIFYSNVEGLTSAAPEECLFTKQQGAEIDASGHAAHYCSVTEALLRGTEIYATSDDAAATLDVIFALKDAAKSGSQVMLQ